MRTLRLVTLAFVLAGWAAGLPGCATAYGPEPYYGGDADSGLPDAWEGDLAQYGSWQTLPQYGTVWYPNVGPYWRPYMYGYWGSGPSGWVWFSNEPWSFTFHYGRWAWAPIGWVWVPGTVWGPAWVNWYWGNGYVGWAPLGYYGAVPWAQFVFINDYDFGCRNIHTVAYRRPPYHQGGYHHGPPPRKHIEHVTHQPVVRVSESQLPNRRPPVRRGEPNRPGPSTYPRDRAQSGGAQTPGGGSVVPTVRVPPGVRPRPPAARPAPDGGPQRRYDVVVPPGTARPTPPLDPRPRVPAARPPHVGAPEPRPPQGNVPAARPPQADVPVVRTPREAPHGSAVAPAPRFDRSPYGGSAVPAAPPAQPRVAPSAPVAPSPVPRAAPPAPSGQFERMQLAPPVMDGGRGAAPRGVGPSLRMH
jgi:hypothetical protein